jgi:hypothetical protein
MTDRKETLALTKQQIKKDTLEIRSLKTRNKILSRNHALGWKEVTELQTLQQWNRLRHYWYFRLKNLYSKKYNDTIMRELNKDYPEKTALFLNEKGAEEMFINALEGLL